MSDIRRLKKLAGLKENTDGVLSDEELDDMKDREWEARNQLEKRMRQVIAETFQKIGISVREDGYSDYGDISFEADNNEASVRIDECTASQIIALNNSGLSSNYVMTGSSDYAIRIEFIVDSRVVDSFRG